MGMSDNNDSTSDEDYVPGKDEEAEDSSCTEDSEDFNEDGRVRDSSPALGHQSQTQPPKSRDELWLEFLGQEVKNATLENVAVSNGTAADSQKLSTHNGINSGETTSTPKLQEPTRISKKTVVMEILEFAGEEVKVEKEVDDEKCRNTSSEKPEAASKPNQKLSLKAPAGLSGVLSEIGKKRKINTLEKSQLDWDTFKKTTKIEEELQQHNRGKAGFLDKQEFLQRADYKQFEKERDLRNASRKNAPAS